ncbi:chemotaxis-specific protein-glutamate methyltransferase CheB [Chryseolinea sp. H1M3-3]|uniref:chemotaxis-specific protein-glutamate methyltransferase CheB n=1 Tax=Chryseolinea sp. H1M3-3 TaxID=3034144 RepID=UPI0023EDE7F2|nr:chemotaxis-specific protein-glutamate methyltransferase CheB [Chryseolinea sp. H1M3-3]
MGSHKVKTLLIEDSGFMRILLSDLLRRDSNIEVIGTAANGLDGVEKVKVLRPDVVITDMVMPRYDGLYVVQQLMKDLPLPIILLSSLDRTDPKIFEALKEGAFDFVDKPAESEVLGGYLPLTRMVREASLTDYLKLNQRLKGKNTFEHTFAAKLNYEIIAIGASTGGPSAVELILSNLPTNLSLPVVIAQHMPERFIESFAVRLNESTGIRVSVAKNGEQLLGQHIYMAPGTANMRIEMSDSGPVVQYVTDEYKEFNQPSIDCLFESVAKIYGRRAVGVILTGMGRDGAVGLNKIKDAGGLTIAQDEHSSVVYGMPKMAMESGAAIHQIPVTEISNFIISAL